ncbi:hypothetical protein PISMIDRAFT_18328 [Pisolithus microcarpus 441]|uniref:Autophagy-related protein 17 n=1 Tax=Pisolithus microcarpus 441 TaxID=765257 RepID=A0A0C9YGC8_9AGAM|nr:hypothetical protein PISMIDRAFT_18328 [Pisolithus microcarpus 441]
MNSPPSETRAEQPPLVSLVVQSKKALQHGEQLCSKANSLTNASAQCAVDVLALDAKVKWVSEAVIEQLKLAASVAKSIELRRSQLERRIRMNRDTDELPAIMSELEESVKAVEAAHEKLLTAKVAASEKLDASSSILNDLDELGEIMSDMLEKQEEIEGDCEDVLEGLQQRLQVVEELHHRYVLYQSSFNKLLVEIARRRQYREAAEKIVDGMERQVREDFNAEHGAHIPADLCPCIENPPTRWDVVPLPGDVRETLPEIDSDLLAQLTGEGEAVDGRRHFSGYRQSVGFRMTYEPSLRVGRELVPRLTKDYLGSSTLSGGAATNV